VTLDSDLPMNAIIRIYIIWLKNLLLLVQPSHKYHRTGNCFTDFLWIITTIQK
jgi:hypothetical protein